MSLPVKVASLGRFARAALESGESRVIAVFERSVYVETPGGLACLGVVGNGPLNAVCGSLPEILGVGDTLACDFKGASAWLPKKPPAIDAKALAESLDLLRSAARKRLPADGFGYLIDTARLRPPPARALERWLAMPDGLPTVAAGLIGHGPGLTPSGDDLIGGALCALHAAANATLAARLADWALPLARLRTNRISNAHLACAAQGECGEAVDDAIVALLSGHAPDLARIDAIGHTSGWDALAGATLALRPLATRE
jgi:hypothetical protein